MSRFSSERTDEALTEVGETRDIFNITLFFSSVAVLKSRTWVSIPEKNKPESMAGTKVQSQTGHE